MKRASQKHPFMPWVKLTLISLSLMPTLALANANWSIIPAADKPFPTTLTPGAAVSAYYTIQNLSNKNRTGYQITGLPAEVIQITTGESNLCPSVISLAPNQSCTLRLDIHAPTITTVALCKGLNCTASTRGLRIEGANQSQQVLEVSVGSYTPQTGSARPLLLYSQDGGSSWAQATSLADPSQYPADYKTGTELRLLQVSCLHHYCVAAGDYTNQSGQSMPLMASTQDNGETWNYAPSIVSALPTGFSALSELGGVSCSESVCVMFASFMDDQDLKQPMVARSEDQGKTWTYSTDVYNPSKLPAPYQQFDAITSPGIECQNSRCILSASFINTDNQYYPILGVSLDAGQTWHYPTEIYENLPDDFSAENGSSNLVGLWGNSCGDQICVAGGEYVTTSGDSLPLLAQSSDGGMSWSYPESLRSPAVLPSDYLYYADFTGTSCSGSYCIAAQMYYTSTGSRPLLASTQNSGETWAYPESIYAAGALPSVFEKTRTNAFFYSTSCDGALCVAAGRAVNASNITLPLLASSTDGGATWSYPALLYTAPMVQLGGNWGSYGNTQCKAGHCLSAGRYTLTTTPSTTTAPLIAQTQDGGRTWGYASLSAALPADFKSGSVYGAAISTP